MERKLAGRTIRLRPVEREDLEALYLMRNESQDAFLSWQPVSYVGQSEWLDRIRHDENKMAFSLVEADPANLLGRLVGFCQIVDIDFRNGTAEIGGFMVATKVRGRGYGHAMVEMLTHFCFVTMGIRKASLTVLASNDVAIQIYEQAGFVCEGTLEKHVWKDGKWRDVLIMSKFAGYWIGDD